MRRKRSRRLLIGIVFVAGVAIISLYAVYPRLAPSGLDQGVTNVLAQGSPAGTTSCQPDHPAFYYGFAALHAQLGDIMGNPLECEHAIHASGDTRQRTTTGYAYYRTSDNVPTFTNGWDHWALTSGGLVHWSGYVVDPPTAHGVGI